MEKANEEGRGEMFIAIGVKGCYDIALAPVASMLLHCNVAWHGIASILYCVCLSVLYVCMCVCVKPRLPEYLYCLVHVFESMQQK